jgi:hypothetical protein
MNNSALTNYALGAAVAVILAGCGSGGSQSTPGPLAGLAVQQRVLSAGPMPPVNVVPARLRPAVGPFHGVIAPDSAKKGNLRRGVLGHVRFGL